MEKTMPLYVTVLRWGAIGVIAVGELILVAGPLLVTPRDWLMRQSADWWGAAGQWAGAVASFAAVVVALWTAIRGARDSARIAAQGAREIQARERRRQQAAASLVRGEFELFRHPYEVKVINESPLPIFNVQVKAVKGERLPEVRQPFQGWQPTAVLAPGKSVLVKAEVKGGSDKGISDWMTYDVVIEFSDVEGYRWRREGDGLPELVE